MRVHELARELGISSRDILLLLEELGIGGKTASSSVPEEHLATVRARLGKAKAPAGKPREAAPPPPKPARSPVQVRAVPASRKPIPAEPAAPAPAAVEPAAEEEAGVITVKCPLTVAEFATALDTDAENVISAAGGMGEEVSTQDLVSAELALLIGEQWGYSIRVEQIEPQPAPQAEPEAAPAAVEEKRAEPESRLAPKAAPTPVVPAKRVRVVPRRVAPAEAPHRPPVVTVMGHVDHGKTTLLDAIRETNVVAEEAGAITQHIGAYQVEVHGRLITFIDTPGHEAFTAMRARGAQVTDIAVLVVAADDGVMPQTLEAVDHARAAGVPIVVAINKIDRPNASVEGVKQRLSEQGLVPEEWGGDTIFVPMSALQKTGVEDLLEMIILMSDMADLRAVRDKPAEGVVLEAKLDRRRGSVATLLVQEGTLRVGDSIVAGAIAGKVRAMTDDRERPLKEATPSTPVQSIGLSGVPEASEVFRVVVTDREARALAEQSRAAAREAQLAPVGPTTMVELSQLFGAGKAKRLRLVLKADVQGSAEAISAALSQLSTEEVQLEILHVGVGEVTESDVSLAAASKPAVLIGFQVGADSQARGLAADERVEIRRYDVIYDLLDDVRDTMTGMLEVVYEDVLVGRAEVRALFRSSRYGTIAGCFVSEGRMARGGGARVVRDGEVVFEGKLDSLRHLQEDVGEMAQGFECGMVLSGFSEYTVGDVIECLEKRQVRRGLV